MIGEAMRALLRIPWLVFAFAVDRVRRLPGARFVAPIVPWVAQAMLLGAGVLILLWMAEASPQRISLADLAAGKLGGMQSWVIVSGELHDEAVSSPGLHRYRLTDEGAPNAFLEVRSPVALELGPATVSGRIEGGRDGVPAGYAWSARLNADPKLASELPPPMAAFVLGLGGLVLVLARRTRYPLFIAESPGPSSPAQRSMQVSVRADGDSLGGRVVPASLMVDWASGGAAELRMTGLRPVPVRLHSAFTSIDVGRLRGLSSSVPVLRVRSAADDLTIAFAAVRDRDAAFATLAIEAEHLRPAT